MKTVKTPKKIKFSKKKAALHKVVEALIKEDMETAAQELQVYLQLKSRELLGEEAEEKEEDEKEDEKEESEDDEDEDDEDEDEKEEVKESLAGFYGVETKTGNFHVKADSKEAAHAAALKKVGKPSDIKNVYFDKAKTKMKSPRKAH